MYGNKIIPSAYAVGIKLEVTELPRNKNVWFHILAHLPVFYFYVSVLK